MTPKITPATDEEIKTAKQLARFMDPIVLALIARIEELKAKLDMSRLETRSEIMSSKPVNEYICPECRMKEKAL